MPTPQNTTSFISYPQSQTGSEPKTVNTDQNIPTPTQAENNTIAVLAMVFAFVFPPAGIILGFYGGKIYKEKKNKDLCTAARAIGMVVAFVLLIIIVTMH
ncbi:MAG: hypothetical protein IK093_19960 [Ruminiclostridium sp.]|nr:hypothetical protein [Ruminiclostridium sp.]